MNLVRRFLNMLLINGYLFKTSENVNKWHFKIVVITTKNIYSANRHIDDKTIGFY